MSTIARSQFGDRVRSAVDFTGKVSNTKKSFRDECDINKIVERFTRTGLLPDGKGPGVYGDFASVPDYQRSCDLVISAERQFLSLDAKVRKRFGNSPVEFLKFVADPANVQEMIDLGLAIRRPSDEAASALQNAGDAASSKKSSKKTSSPPALSSAEIARLREALSEASTDA